MVDSVGYRPRLPMLGKEGHSSKSSWSANLYTEIINLLAFIYRRVDLKLLISTVYSAIPAKCCS